MIEALETIPGVRGAAISSAMPMGNGTYTTTPTTAVGPSLMAPGDAIPAGLQSKAPLLRPWPWLREELARVHGEILRTLAAAPPDFVTDARAPIVMVVNVTDERGQAVPLHWVEELDWKAYAIVWRLHVIDHLKQAKKIHAALER